MHLTILRASHDEVGHKGFYATNALISLRFWWPLMRTDIHWFVRTCRPCQLRQICNVLIPPVIATPVPLFGKMYVDTMHMPKSGGFRYIVQGRCSLSHFVEFRMLLAETGKTLGDWLFEDVVCRWGGLFEIVSDNGPPFVEALEYLSRRYHINHIRISGYNSRANGLVERSHFDVQQALFKLTEIRRSGLKARILYFGLIVSPFAAAWAVRLTLQLPVRTHCSLLTSPKRRTSCRHPWRPSQRLTSSPPTLSPAETTCPLDGAPC